MGENADDMIEGLTCSECGIYFQQQHGYPVLCKNCYDEDSDEGVIPEIPRATESEL